MTEPRSIDTTVRNRSNPWTWVALVVALVWIVLVRWPLVLNAAHHLDSDLAVDGLTLAEALDGNWRWHYPGTPHMGILPVLLSLPQAMVAGASPYTLVSGGVVAYGLVVVAIFTLARRAYGIPVALWGLLPLAFASTGIVWLSGRITGGHLLAVAWHAAALTFFHEAVRRGGTSRLAWLGFWCGLGIYLDGMMVFTSVAMLIAGFSIWLVSRDPDPRWGWSAIAIVLGYAIGYAPRAIGAQLDGYDSYGEQFTTIFATRAVPDHPGPKLDWDQARLLGWEHSRLLLRDCLPRLIAGHRLPSYQSEPEPTALAVPGAHRPGESDAKLLAVATTWLSLSLALLSVVALSIEVFTCRDRAGIATRLALTVASMIVIAGFLVNKNIYNSDNYRYLVYLIVPWALGFGVLMRYIASRGAGGSVVAMLLAGSLAVLMSLDARDWYSRFGWVQGWIPVEVERRDSALDWLREHPDVTSIFGDYWDVYRLAFLTGGRTRGVPYPNYPNRFPEWSLGLPGGRPRVLIARSDGLGPFYRRSAAAQGAGELYRDRDVIVIDWP